MSFCFLASLTFVFHLQSPYICPWALELAKFRYYNIFLFLVLEAENIKLGFSIFQIAFASNIVKKTRKYLQYGLVKENQNMIRNVSF